MNNDSLDIPTLIDKLFFGTNFSIHQFRELMNQIDSQFFHHNPKQPSIIFPIIETLIV